jgi:hypothetical protein
MSGGGNMVNNSTVGESYLCPTISANTHTIGYQTAAAAAKEAQTITVTVYRLGLVIFSDNATEVVTQTNQTIQQFQLEKYGEGWLYNNFISENELPEANLLYPMPNMDPEIPEFPTGAISTGIFAVMLVLMLTKKKLKPR